MSGGWKCAKHAGRRPLDGRVRHGCQRPRRGGAAQAPARV